MPNTALNRTTQALLTNKSGGNLAYGDVVVLDNTNANGFTTTTTAGLSTRGLGVILEPSGIANNASGMVAVGGWCPKINLNTAAAVGQFIKTHTVAGQGTPHASPQVEGDFAVALTASATPSCNLFGSPNGPLAGGSGTVTNTGTLTSGKTIIGNGSADVTVSSLTAQFVGSSSGTEAAASMTTARLLGRTTASSGAVEEITVGTGLTLSGGSLTNSGGGLVLLEQHTASGSTNLDFTTFISSTYDTYQIVGLGIVPSSNGAHLLLEVGTGGGPTYDTGSNYEWAAIGFDTNGGTQSFSGFSGVGRVLNAISNTSGFQGVFNWTAANLQSTSVRKTFWGTSHYVSSQPRSQFMQGGLEWVTTGTAATALRFTVDTGTWSGTIRIYGLAK